MQQHCISIASHTAASVAAASISVAASHLIQQHRISITAASHLIHQHRISYEVDERGEEKEGKAELDGAFSAFVHVTLHEGRLHVVLVLSNNSTTMRGCAPGGRQGDLKFRCAKKFHSIILPAKLFVRTTVRLCKHMGCNLGVP